MMRLWIWAFGPRGEGFALLMAIVAPVGLCVFAIAGIAAFVYVLAVAVFR